MPRSVAVGSNTRSCAERRANVATNCVILLLAAPQKTAAYAAWPRQSQREYCDPPARTDTTLPAALRRAAVDRATRKNLPAQPCQCCRDAVAADRTGQPEKLLKNAEDLTRHLRTLSGIVSLWITNIES